MAKSLKNLRRSNSLSNLISVSFGNLTAVRAKLLCAAAVFIFSYASSAQAAPAAPKPSATPKASAKVSAKVSPKSSQGHQLETFKDLIAKAQNLTLQRDRLQASQILIRAIQREPKNSLGFKELSRALTDLTTVFYTERAQSAFIAGEANLPAKPKEAIESFQEALRLEDGNVSVLKALARTHLAAGDCDKAESFVKPAEALDPYSPEVILLRLQAWDCSKSSALLAEKLFSSDAALATVEAPLRGIQIRELVRSEDFKKAKSVLDKWSVTSKDYPEVIYWTFELSKQSGTVDRAAGQRYVQVCQNLTPRKRKSFNLDVDLCKGREAVEASLKESADEG